MLFQQQPLEVFYQKGVHKNFAKFTEKHLCHSLFNKVSEFFEISKNTFFTEHLRTLVKRLDKKPTVNCKINDVTD